MVNVLKGKGSKGRTAHMAGECSRVLMRYLSEYPRPESDYMFTTLRKGLQLQPFVVRRVVKTVAARISKEDGKKVHPHLFRHSLASNMLSRGAGLLTIKEQLGHADIHTTMGYITAREEHIRSEYHRFVPSHL
jgi:site-specific recombinase XerD